jgi:hypothetical protein
MTEHDSGTQKFQTWSIDLSSVKVKEQSNVLSHTLSFEFAVKQQGKHHLLIKTPLLRRLALKKLMESSMLSTQSW